LRALVLVLALFFPGIARANTQNVGLLVTGDALSTPTQDHAAKWLRAQGRGVVIDPLSAAAIKTLLDCFVLDDPKCARNVIDARATTDSLVSIRIAMVSSKDQEVQLTIDWFVKGTNPVSARRTCAECNEAVLRTTLDAMLLDLARTSPGFLGRIKLSSDPPGLTVLLDNETVGVTPIERDVAAGAHRVRLVRDGRMGAEKTVKVEPGALSEVKLQPPPEGSAMPDELTAKKSRALPAGMMLLGIVAAGAGAGMWFGMHKEPAIDDYEYRDWKTAGQLTMSAGGIVAITGFIWLLSRGNAESGPVVGATASGDTTIGWSGRF
jgi:hypothetical protein